MKPIKCDSVYGQTNTIMKTITLTKCTLAFKHKGKHKAMIKW